MCILIDICAEYADFGGTVLNNTYPANMHIWDPYGLYLGKPIWVCPYWTYMGPIWASPFGYAHIGPIWVPYYSTIRKNDFSFIYFFRTCLL